MKLTFKAIQGSQAGAGFADSSTLDAGQKVDSAVNDTQRHAFSQEDIILITKLLSLQFSLLFNDLCKSEQRW